MESFPYTEIISDHLIDNPDILFVVIFPESSSVNFEIVLDLALRVSYFSESRKVNGDLLFIAGFAPTRRDMMLLSSLAQLTHRWRGVHILYRGMKVMERLTVVSTLDCIEKAGRLESVKEWCKQSLSFNSSRRQGGMIEIPVMRIKITLPNEEDSETPQANLKVGEQVNVIVPCRRLYLSYSDFTTDVKLINPTTAQNIIHAKAIENNCDWCPNFKLSAIFIKKEPYLVDE